MEEFNLLVVPGGENPGALLRVLGTHCCPKQQYLFLIRFPGVYFLIELVFLASLLAVASGALTRTAALPKAMAAKERVAGGLLAVLRWDTAAARAAPSRPRQDNTTGASSR